MEKTFIRKGQCLHCGRCSQAKTLMGSDKEDIKNAKFLFGIDLDEMKCPHLGFIDGKAHCTNYENRPEFCREYPGEPGDLIDEKCGFKFYSN